MTFSHSAPRFSALEAAAAARDHYGLDVRAKPLVSHLDQNFLLEGAGATTVLKIANAAADPASVDLQQSALRHVAGAQNGAQCPMVVPAVSGDQAVSVKGHIVWLVSYLEGRLFGDVRPRTQELARSVGSLMARLDRCLDSFEHPYLDREQAWDLRRAGCLLEYVHHIHQDDRRCLVDAELSRFCDEGVPALSTLRVSPIHNDGNDANILVRGAGYEAQASGIIDFGDMTRAPLICEVAIAATYAMLGTSDPVGMAVAVVRGYHAVYPLQEQEVAQLRDLICARLCSSVLVSAYRSTVEPANTYLRVSEEPAWRLLDWMVKKPAELLHCRFREACAMEPCATSKSIVFWLRQHQEHFAPVMEPDVRTVPPLVLDLSAESLIGANPGESVAPETALARILNAASNAGAAMGLGRYNEARLVYDTGQFVTSHGERRTVHLGIDLFREAGSPVFAPLEGEVAGFRNCSGPRDYGGVVMLRHRADREIFYTLYGHLSPAFECEPGQLISRGQQIGCLGAPEDNGGWAPHLHFQIICNPLGMIPDFPGVAAPSARRTWLSLCPDPNLILGVRTEAFPRQALSTSDIWRLRRRHVGPNLSVTYRTPLHIVRGYLQHLYDIDGRAYLDGANNVPHVGHCHPWVVRAGQRQNALLCTNTRYLHSNMVRYGERLAATLPEGLDICYFVNSGSEANDLAMQLARAYTGRKGTIVLNGAYHGHLSSLIEISPYKHDGPGGRGAPDHVYSVVLPDAYRGPYVGMTAETATMYARHVYAGIEELHARGWPVAVFICESLMSCGGQIEFPPGYLREVYSRVRAAGGVCIADEVQVGLGRMGTHFWGFETQDVVPDIVVMGKPMGNGHPLSAVVTTAEIASVFDNGMEFFSTYGGNNVSCAVGMAVMDVIEREGLQRNALVVGTALKEALKDFMPEHEVMGDVRGRGLFVGVELVRNRISKAPAPECARYVADRMRDLGILVSTDGPDRNVLKMKPPMVFDESNADRLLTTMGRVLSEDAVRLSAS